jgi:polysaccharide biosynthesis transport protein
MQNDQNNSGNNRTELLTAAPVPFPSNTAGWYAEEYEGGLNVRDYWYILKRRKWWALGITAGAVLIGFLIILFMPPIWEGKITLQITQDKGSSALGSAGSSMDPLGEITGSSDLDRFYQTQYAILHSPAIAYGLIDTLSLQNDPSYKRLIKKNPHDPPGATRQKFALDLLKNLKVRPVPNSYLVDVIFHTTDKALAQKVPAAVQAVYLNLCMRTRQQSFVMLKHWLDRQLAEIAKKLVISEKSTIAAGQKNDFMGMDVASGATSGDGGIGNGSGASGTNVVLQKYLQVAQLLTTAQGDLAAKKALYDQIAQKGSDAPVIVNNPLIQSLRGQLIAAEGQATGSSQVYGPRYPGQKVSVAALNEIRKKLTIEVGRQVTGVRSDYQAALKTEKLLQQEFNDAKAKVAGMENGLVEFHMLKRDLETNQALYQGLLGRMKDAAVAATLVPSNIAVINSSEEPYKPYLPKPDLFLACALVLGIFMGIGTAFTLEYLDSTIKTVEELERIGHIPTLGMIPMIENGEIPKTPLETISYFDPKSHVSESVSHIRSAVMLSSSSSPPQVLVLTSCNPMEGKSTTSCNIATSMRLGDRKCIILDCDLRKPRLHKVFKVSNRRGISNVVTGNATLEEVVKATGVPDLYFLPAGPTPPNPCDLISSATFRKMILTLREQYQHIIIDSPPVIGFADARLLAAVSDGVVLVFRHNSTTRESARLAVQMISQNNSHILGGILTMVKKEQMGYGAYYSYYKYYNKYYESYKDSSEKLPEGERPSERQK